MSVVAYSTCRIQYMSADDDENVEHDYSERSIIELRQNDITDYSIRAVDVENDNAEIFNFRIEKNDQYNFGTLDFESDTIDDPNGTYELWLNEDSRCAFHETFHSILEILFPQDTRRCYSESLSESSIPIEFSEPEPIHNPSNPMNCDPGDVLPNIRKLSRCIKQGNAEEAARIAKELAVQHVQLQAKSLINTQTEEEFQIQVQFDGNEYSIDQSGATIPVNVFPSTTIRELRAVFELAYNYSPTSQYFFVNGDLAHDKASMRDLKVGPNSIFVLYLITHPKIFKNNGPWECASCSMHNVSDSVKCHLCKASRTN